MATVARLGVHLESTGADRVQQDLRSVQQGVQRTHAETVKLGAAIGAASAAATAGFNAMAGAAQAAFGAFTGAAVGLNSSLEQANIAFTTMLGSGERAAAFLQELQTFAAQTPFEFPQLVDASKRMMAFGFAAEQVKPLLTAVGDAAAAMGTGAEGMNRITTALGQMQAKGKATAEEFMQLTEAGIPAWQMLADKLGTDVAGAMKAVEQRTVEASTAISAFQEGVASRFGGMMAAQSQTFAGAMSTIKDSLQMAVADGFKPLFAVMADAARALSAFVQGEGFAGWATQLQASVSEALTTLGTFRDWLMSHLAEPLAQVQRTVEHLAPVFQTAFGGLQAALSGVQDNIEAFAGFWSSLTSSADGAATGLEAVGNQIIGLFHDVLVPAVQTFAGIWAEAWQNFRIWLADAYNAATPTVEAIGQWFDTTLVPPLQNFAGMWQDFWDRAGPTLTATWAVIQPIFVAIKDFFGDVLLGTLNEFKRRWDETWKAIGQVWEVLQPILGPLADKFGAAINEVNIRLRNTLQDMAPPVAQAAEDTGTKVRQAFIQGVAPVTQDVTQVAEAAGVALGQTLQTTATAAIEAAAPPAVAEAVDLGEAITAGIQQGVEGGSPGLSRSLSAVVTDGLNNTRAVLRARSPSQKAAEELGEPIPEGIAEGIRAKAGTVHTAITTMLEAAFQSGGGVVSRAVSASLDGPNALALGARAQGAANVLEAQRAALQAQHAALGRRYTEARTWNLRNTNNPSSPETMALAMELQESAEAMANLQQAAQALQVPITEGALAQAKMAQTAGQASAATAGLTAASAALTEGWIGQIRASTDLFDSTGGLIRPVVSLADATKNLAGGFKATYQAGSGLATMQQTITSSTQAAADALARAAAQGWELSKAWGAALRAGELLVGGMRIPASVHPTQLFTSANQPRAGEGNPSVGTSSMRQGFSYYGVPIVSPITPGYTSIPQFAAGGVMPWDGLAYVHKGETVTPAGGSSRPVTININITGSGSRLLTEADLVDTLKRTLPRLMASGGVLG